MDLLLGSGVFQLPTSINQHQATNQEVSVLETTLKRSQHLWGFWSQKSFRMVHVNQTLELSFSGLSLRSLFLQVGRFSKKKVIENRFALTSPSLLPACPNQAEPVEIHHWCKPTLSRICPNSQFDMLEGELVIVFQTVKMWWWFTFHWWVKKKGKIKFLSSSAWLLMTSCMHSWIFLANKREVVGHPLLDVFAHPI